MVVVRCRANYKQRMGSEGGRRHLRCELSGADDGQLARIEDLRSYELVAISTAR